MKLYKYRIVKDAYAGYEVQWRTWYWPFWHCIGSNTHASLEEARSYIEYLKSVKVLEYHE